MQKRIQEQIERIQGHERMKIIEGEERKMNTEREVIEKLKRILEEIDVEYSNILLVGSRTGDVFEEESDWDFLIVVKKNLDLKENRELWYKIYRRFHEYFPFIPVDMILKGEQSFENEKEVANTLACNYRAIFARKS